MAKNRKNRKNNATFSEELLKTILQKFVEPCVEAKDAQVDTMINCGDDRFYGLGLGMFGEHCA